MVNVGTDEARRRLNRLVNQFRSLRRAHDSMLDGAVRIGPHRSGGALLVPEIDVEAHLRRERELERRVAELEAEIEDVRLASLVAERETLPGEEHLSFSQLARGVGYGHMADDDA